MRTWKWITMRKRWSRAYTRSWDSLMHAFEVGMKTDDRAIWKHWHSKWKLHRRHWWRLTKFGKAKWWI